MRGSVIIPTHNEARAIGRVLADRVATPQLAVALAVLVGFATSIWLRRADDQWSPDVFAWPMAALLMLLEYRSVATSAAIIAVRRIGRPMALQSSADR